MAYVVARPRGRFEIRESVHTPNGPWARSLANFSRLDDEVLDRARRRASRPFDARRVRSSARRAGVPVRTRRRRPTRRSTDTEQARHFVESSRRMAASLEPRPAAAAGGRPDPGDALIGLLDLVDQIRPFTPERPPEPLGFPPLAQVAQRTRETTERERGSP